MSEKIGITAAEITKRLFKEGIMKTINDSIDFDTAAIVAEEMGCKYIDPWDYMKDYSDYKDKMVYYLVWRIFLIALSPFFWVVLFSTIFYNR